MPTQPHKRRQRKTAIRTLAVKLPVQIVARPRAGLPSRPSNWTAYALTIFLGAFLLFQVELILGKFVLPRFGGGPSVWSTSLLTFQFLLLAGYGYVALLTRHFAPRTQAQIHLSLLVASALALLAMTLKWHSPILPLTADFSSSNTSPVLQIVLLLVFAVGFPCVLLSASSPLLQKWFNNQSVNASPYRLYALSNLGSMLGLLSYPFAIERLLTLHLQSELWAFSYALFLVITAICAWPQLKQAGVATVPVAIPVPRRNSKPSGVETSFLVLALSACGSVMLLATTNLICQEVAVIPLLWVLPLSLYLLSFIVSFDHARWYRREIFNPLYLALGLLSLRTLVSFSEMSSRGPLLILCSTLFAVCMVCHGELARLKPEPQRLTGFYLTISAGGLIGSAFVVLVAPHLFTRFWEFQIALGGCGLLLAIMLVRDRGSWLYGFRFGRLVFAAALVLMIGASYYTGRLRNRDYEGGTAIWRARNFFGIKTVLQYPRGLVLRHGRTIHGTQSADSSVRDMPTMYYRPESGIGLLLQNYPLRLLGPLRIGVIGMGAGTLAAYGHPRDLVRFYEIDPDIVGLSQGQDPLFTYVKDSHARVEIATGDARIVLQQELARSGGQQFDVLAVDAFSGDAIPVHLLTREALALYLQHLRGSLSVIAFHISNQSVDLRPVIAALAQDKHLASLEIYTPGVSDWILLSANPEILATPALASVGRPIELNQPALLWTDDYSNLFSVLKTW